MSLFTIFVVVSVMGHQGITTSQKRSTGKLLVPHMLREQNGGPTNIFLLILKNLKGRVFRLLGTR